jgi:UDP-N-acetylglucosamine acyltransferase
MGSGCVVHPTALVSSEAELGSGVTVGPYSVIEAGARVGDGTVVGAFARIADHVEIGRRCSIFEGVVVGGIPQDHDFRGETSSVRIGDDVILREHVTVNKATGEGGLTSVGDGCMIMESCHVGHNVLIGNHCTITNKVGLSGHVELGDWVVIGGISGFHQFVKVGSYAMVGGLSKVIKDVPPYSLVDGNPASFYGLNVVGLRRRGFTQEQRNKIKRVYKLLYDRHLKRDEALSAIEEQFGDDEMAREIVRFVRSLRRGLTPWHGRGFVRGESEREF